MIITRLVAVLSVFIVACASEEKNEDKLLGIWGSVESSNSFCGYGVNIRGDETYSFLYLCELESGAQGAVREDGTYTIDEDSVTFTPEASSCPDSPNGTRPVTYAYKLTSADTATFTTTTGTLTFERITDKNSSMSTGQITFGCSTRTTTSRPEKSFHSKARRFRSATASATTVD